MARRQTILPQIGKFFSGEVAHCALSGQRDVGLCLTALARSLQPSRAISAALRADCSAGNLQ
jgi:hypothetical protein